jgi:transposase
MTARVSGKQLHQWQKKEYPKIADLASKLGISLSTLYAWFRKPELEHLDLLALAQIGFPQAIEAARQITRPAIGQS